MSEYQYYHFRAIDQALDDDAFEFMQQQSTRAEVSRWEFTNEYHFGNFRGNCSEMLRRGYDVHLYFANFRVRKLAFRLPELPCDQKTFDRFADGYDVQWERDAKGSAGILWVTPECEDYETDFIFGLSSMLDRIAPARELLIQGDLRPLYLFWLNSCFDDDAVEPPIPAGLQSVVDGSADDCLMAIVEFLEIDHDLLTVAAEQSPSLPEQAELSDVVQKWLSKQSKASLQNVAEQLLLESGAQQAVLRQIRSDGDESIWPCTETDRTWAAIYEDVEEIRQRRRQQHEQEERQRLENERQAKEKARQKFLKTIQADPMATIRRIDKCVQKKCRKNYQEAAAHLKDFSEAMGADAAQAEADRLRREYSSRSALLDELEHAGL